MNKLIASCLKYGRPKANVSAFLFLIFHITFSTLKAQSHKIDSLRSVLKTEKADTNKVNTLNTLSRQLCDQSDYPQSDSLAQNALSLAEKTSFKKGMGSAYANIGNIYYHQGKYAEALKNQLQALKIEQEIGNKYGTGNAYIEVGHIYDDQANYPEALKDYLQALKIYQEIKNKPGMGTAYGNIGNIYWYQGNYPEALKNQQQALKISQEIGNKEGMGYAYGNIGNIYDDEGNHSEALKNQLQALKIDEELGDRWGMGADYTNIGNIYSEQGNYLEALKNQLQSLKIFREVGGKEGMGYAYTSIGSILTHEKKYANAKAYLDSAMILSKMVGSRDITRDTYNNYAAYDSATGNFEKSLTNYKLYIIYRDSLKNKENDKKILSQQMSFDFQHTQDSLKNVQDKKDAVQAESLKKQKIISVAIAGGLALAFLFMGFVIRSLRVTRRQKNVIEKQKTEVENKNILIEEQKKVVEEKNSDIIASINYAKRLQDAILPPLDVIKKYLPESFLLYKPKDIVAGDFYWMERVDNNILIAACDCTGHGVPGAMVSVVCSSALNRAVKEFHICEPGKILDKVRELVLETFGVDGEVKDGMDCSFCAINTKTSHIEWSGAYNPLWYISNGKMNEITASKQPIGKHDAPIPFYTANINLQRGDILYLFTDGYADQFGGPKGKKFKYKQMQELLLANIGRPMEEQGRILNETLDAWKGSLEQVDDILVIGIKMV